MPSCCVRGGREELAVLLLEWRTLETGAAFREAGDTVASTQEPENACPSSACPSSRSRAAALLRPPPPPPNLLPISPPHLLPISPPLPQALPWGKDGEGLVGSAGQQVREVASLHGLGKGAELGRLLDDVPQRLVQGLRALGLGRGSALLGGAGPVPRADVQPTGLGGGAGAGVDYVTKVGVIALRGSKLGAPDPGAHRHHPVPEGGGEARGFGGGI